MLVSLARSGVSVNPQSSRLLCQTVLQVDPAVHATHHQRIAYGNKRFIWKLATGAPRTRSSVGLHARRYAMPSDHKVADSQFLLPLTYTRLPMPKRAPTPCRHPGCAALLLKPGFCPNHQSLVHRDYGRARRLFDPELRFYQSPTWRRLRKLVLSQDTLCRTCSIAGRIALATVVDHIVPVKAGGARFDIANLQGLCVACHNRKTAIETARRSATPRGFQSLGGKPSDAQGGQDYCGREIHDPLSAGP